MISIDLDGEAEEEVKELIFNQSRVLRPGEKVYLSVTDHGRIQLSYYRYGTRVFYVCRIRRMVTTGFTADEFLPLAAPGTRLRAVIDGAVAEAASQPYIPGEHSEE